MPAHPVSGAQLQELDQLLKTIRTAFNDPNGCSKQPESALKPLRALARSLARYSEALLLAKELSPGSHLDQLVELNGLTRQLFRKRIRFARLSPTGDGWLQTIDDLRYVTIDELELGTEGRTLLQEIMEMLGLAFASSPPDRSDWIRTIRGPVPPNRYPTLNPAATTEGMALFTKSGLGTIAAFLEATYADIARLVELMTMRNVKEGELSADQRNALSELIAETQTHFRRLRTTTDDGFSLYIHLTRDLERQTRRIARPSR